MTGDGLLREELVCAVRARATSEAATFARGGPYRFAEFYWLFWYVNYISVWSVNVLVGTSLMRSALRDFFRFSRNSLVHLLLFTGLNGII